MMNSLWVLIVYIGLGSSSFEMLDKAACVRALEEVKPAQAYCLSRRYGEIIKQEQ